MQGNNLPLKTDKALNLATDRSLSLPTETLS